MEPLFETRDQCGGTGETRPPPTPPAGSYGPRIIAYTHEPCPKCNGQKRVLTAAGKAVGEVMEHLARHAR